MVKLQTLGRKLHIEMQFAKHASGIAAGFTGAALSMGGAAPAFAADMDSWEVADSGNNATGGTTENGDGPGDVILSMVTAVFAQIKIFCAALLVLCAVVYALVSVFSSRPEIWRGKIVYVAIILVCLLCLGIILTFIEEKVGSGSYSLFQGIDVNGDGSTDTE